MKKTPKIRAIDPVQCRHSSSIKSTTKSSIQPNVDTIMQKAFLAKFSYRCTVVAVTKLLNNFRSLFVHTHTPTTCTHMLLYASVRRDTTLQSYTITQQLNSVHMLAVELPPFTKSTEYGWLNSNNKC